MTKRSLVATLLVVLCASIALFAAKNQDMFFRLDGTQAYAHVMQETSDHFVNASFEPSQLPDGRMGYLVDIIWRAIPSGWEEYNEIGGLVPASAVRLRGENVDVDITPDTFVEIDPLRVHGDPEGSLVGTFAIYTGPGSYSGTSSGNEEEVSIQLDGSTDTHIYVGTDYYGSATFVGIVGSYSISTSPTEYGVQLGFRKGTERRILTTP